MKTPTTEQILIPLACSLKKTKSIQNNRICGYHVLSGAPYSNTSKALPNLVKIGSHHELNAKPQI
jgi:hypothetical protein